MRFSLLLLGASLLCGSAPLSAETILLNPGERSEQMFLDQAPAGTHFAAEGVVFRVPEVKNGHPFANSLPEFCLFSSRRHDPENGIGYARTGLLEALEVSNAARYPLQIRDLESPSISGFAVIGQQPRLLPWRVMKAMWDGDALHVKGCTGKVTVRNVAWDNVEDGFGPNSGIDSWLLDGAYMRNIRDDAIENDDLISGTVRDSLIDGCFTFLSQRADPAWKSHATTTVENCLVHIQPQPHDGIPGKEWRDRFISFGEDGIGRAPGMAFKWGIGGGSVVVKDTIFRIDAMSVNGPDDMGFPPGVYENVTVVWLGSGSYPRKLPEGVTIVTDQSIWEASRLSWLATHPDHPVHVLKEDH